MSTSGHHGEQVRRGDGLLLAHCRPAACPAVEEQRAPAVERLERQVGSRLTRVLVFALDARK